MARVRLASALLAGLITSVATLAMLLAPPAAPAYAGDGDNLLTDLVAWWDLDEETGTRIDAHGDNDLTDNNTVTQASGPEVGSYAAQFVAANTEYLSRASEADLQTGNVDFTFAGWVYCDTFVDHRVMAGKGDEWYINFTTGAANQIKMVIRAGATAAVWIPVFTADTWYFVVGYYDSVNDKVGISVNGSASPTEASDSIGPSADNVLFTLGVYPPGISVPLDGRVARAGFWKRLLTTAEWSWLYNSGDGRTYTELGSAGTPTSTPTPTATPTPTGTPTPTAAASDPYTFTLPSGRVATISATADLPGLIQIVLLVAIAACLVFVFIFELTRMGSKRW